MKRIFNTSVPVVMSTTRTPLSISLSVGQEGENGGPLTQAQDVAHSLWQPNRRLHPLFLRPLFEGKDPDNGEVVTSGYEVKWYLVSKNITPKGTLDYAYAQEIPPAMGKTLVKRVSPLIFTYMQDPGGKYTWYPTGTASDGDKYLVRSGNLSGDHTSSNILKDHLIMWNEAAGSWQDLGVYSDVVYTEITSYTTSDDYYKELDGDGNLTGRLVVRKNVSYDAPVTIACRVTYADSLRMQTYTKERLVMLTTENKPEAFYSVKIQSPNTLTFNPIVQKRDTALSAGAIQYGSLFRISAKAALASEDATEQVVFFWYAGDTLISESLDCMFYSASNQLSGKGQGTDTIVVDMDYADTIDISVAIGYFEPVDSPSGSPSAKGYYELVNGSYVQSGDTTASVAKNYYTRPSEPNVPASDKIALTWQWPDIEALPYSKGGSTVRESGVASGRKEFAAFLQADGVNIDDAVADEFIRLEWKLHGMNSSEVATVGWGREVTINTSDLYRTGYENVEVYPDIWLLGCKKLVAGYDSYRMENGNLVGVGPEKIVTANGKYVVSRW